MYCAISERGGVLGAMDTMVQCGKIQEDSRHVGHKKHDGSLPLVGVNTFLGKDGHSDVATEIELIRSTEEKKGQQITNVAGYQANRNAGRGGPTLPAEDRPRAPQRVRGADGGGEDAFAGADQPCVV